MSDQYLALYACITRLKAIPIKVFADLKYYQYQNVTLSQLTTNLYNFANKD